MKKILLLILIFLAFSVIFMGVSYMISPPLSGQNLAGELGLPYPAIIAHRGLSYEAPESTTIAYINALDTGADFLEADLQRTSDGVIVIFHDDNLMRTSNVTEVFPGREREPIYNFSYEDLLQLDFGSWFNEAYPERAREEYKGLKIITLDELIDIAKDGDQAIGLYLETKNPQHYPEIEVEIVEILWNRGLVDTHHFYGELDNKENINENAEGLPVSEDEDSNIEKVNDGANITDEVDLAEKAKIKLIIQSFHYESLEMFKELIPEIPRVLLISNEMSRQKGFDNLIEKASEVGQGIGPVGYISWPWNIRKAHQAGLVVHTYTINAPWQMKLLRQFGVDGIFTDRSDLAIEILGIDSQD